jgi:hypothetical protein
VAEVPGFTRDDLRAGVAAGVLSEAQAARLLTIAEAREGVRASGEDEPFELFRGFAEVFVSVGLVLLLTGLFAMTGLVANPLVVVISAMLLCAALAAYFTLVRRMVLPSVVLVSGFAGAAMLFSVFLVRMIYGDGASSTALGLSGGAIVGLALVIWYRIFRVPFTMFLLGLTGLVMVFVLTQGIVPTAEWTRLADIFDLREGSGLAVGTLIFGLLAFLVAMGFDMRDPHRLGRRAASGFWLHLMAAPALVNTVALTFWNMQSLLGYSLLALSLLVITLLALVIDRRSYLTAGIGTLAVPLSLVLKSGDGDYSWIGIVLSLGLFVTALGAFWTQVRASLMRVLPGFPGKHRLPPYSE